jgi:type II secretory pathway component PulF
MPPTERSPGHHPVDGLHGHQDQGPEAAAKAAAQPQEAGRTFSWGVKQKDLTLFTRQLSILQDAGLPILRSLKVLAEMQKPGATEECAARRLR